MKFRLINYFKLDRSAKSVVFVGRDIDTRKKHYFLVDDFYPYFGVPWEERNTHKDHYSIVKIDSSNDIYGNKIAKITVKRADNVPMMTPDYSMTYESKTLFHDRVKIDLDIKAGFIIPDEHIKGLCFARQCMGNKRLRRPYHSVSHQVIEGW